MANKHNNPSLDEVLIECSFHLGKGVGDAEVKPDAFEFWTTRYRRTFDVGLNLATANWKEDKQKVLPLAEKLGKIAVGLAKSGPIDVTVAETASGIVENDPSCQPAPVKGQPRPMGKYCQA